MRRMILLALGICLAAASPALAFHDDGVAYCGGCHTMHNSQDGELVDPDAPNGNPWLLTDGTPSDVCLNCHATRLGAVLGSDPLNPPPTKGGGNFVFLTEDNINDGHAGGTNPISGEKAGHNIHAPGHGLAVDGTLSTGPGGTFPSSFMGCTSCHDPHGNEDFRLLYGAGRQIHGGVYTFQNPAPVAVGLSVTGGTNETNGTHTAYQSGMSDWCANCHGDFHNSGNLVHPTGANLGGTIAQQYSLYNGTESITGGNPSTAYLAAVPFEDATMTTTTTAGPSASSKVACITCHRAHATSAPDAGRWDFRVTLLEEDGLESGSYPIPDPYDSPNQRSLCNKCHIKDEFDHIVP